MLSSNDISFIKEKGITEQQIQDQISRFEKGFPELNIIKPAGLKDGVRKLTEKQVADFEKAYEKLSKRLKKVKFVPASGAATRMFKHLYEVLNNYSGSEDDYLKLMADKSFNSFYYMCHNIRNFAFYNDLVEAVENKGSSIEEISKKKDFPFLLKTLLQKDGLNYGNLPKGLLKFHRTFTDERTPVQEQLLEGIFYARSGKKVELHFTVSPEHEALFKNHVNGLLPQMQSEHKVKFKIEFSVQKPSTDTIAVNNDLSPVRDENNNLLFRPGGHGALIYNLNEIDADLIFVKNIDNVVQDRMKEDTYVYKRVLAGVLLSVREKAAFYYKKLNKKPTEDLIIEAGEFLRKKMFTIAPFDYCEWDTKKKVAFLKEKLNRPIRVCGVVRNEGEPGGGPFWVEGKDGSKSLQIVESSQFAENQKEILSKASYFNPVDIVCSTKNLQGRKFDLLEYIDHNTGFISTKSVAGKTIKALELPGLWNGAMANWNTIFIEVPISTFNPVKTVNDLLRAEHLFERDLLQADEYASKVEI